MTNEQRSNRCIRLSDAEWSVFKSSLGMAWLRKQIAKAAKRRPAEKQKNG